MTSPCFRLSAYAEVSSSSILRRLTIQDFFVADNWFIPVWGILGLQILKTGCLQISEELKICAQQFH